MADLTSTATGVLTINGVAIAYDTTTESLNAILTKINMSDAGVVASIDRTNDRIVIAGKTAGASAISIVDTSAPLGGGLGAALNLAPGTTNAQVIGQRAQVTVDGRIVTSDTNTVTNAIDGVALTLLDQSTTTATLTIGVDSTAIQKSLNDLVASYNALADTLDKLTTHVTGAPSAPLEGDATASQLSLSIRGMLMSVSTTVTSGTLRSLGDIGLNSGAIGAKAGTTTRLTLDTTKLSAALAANPIGVAGLLGMSGGIMQPIVDRLKALKGTGGLAEAATSSVDRSLRLNSAVQAQVQVRIDLKQSALERKFAALEATLALLQNQSSQVTAQANAFNSSSSG